MQNSSSRQTTSGAFLEVKLEDLQCVSSCKRARSLKLALPLQLLVAATQCCAGPACMKHTLLASE